MKWKGLGIGAVAGVIFTGTPMGLVLGMAAGYLVEDKFFSDERSAMVSLSEELDDTAILMAGSLRVNRILFRGGDFPFTKELAMLGFSGQQIKALHQRCYFYYKNFSIQLLNRKLENLCSRSDFPGRYERALAAVIILESAILGSMAGVSGYVQKLGSWFSLSPVSLEKIWQKYQIPHLHFYRILQASPLDPEEKIKQRVRTIARHSHPDAGNLSDEQIAGLKSVNHAWSMIRRWHTIPEFR